MTATIRLEHERTVRTDRICKLRLGPRRQGPALHHGLSSSLLTLWDPDEERDRYRRHGRVDSAASQAMIHPSRPGARAALRCHRGTLGRPLSHSAACADPQRARPSTRRHRGRPKKMIAPLLRSARDPSKLDRIKTLRALRGATVFQENAPWQRRKRRRLRRRPRKRP